MDISEKAFKLIYKYAKKLAYNSQDIDDIVQESAELLLENPPKGHLTKAFYFKLVQRGRHRHYYYGVEAQRRNMMVLGQDDFIALHPDEYNLENVYHIAELRALARKRLNKLSFMEKKIANLILDGQEADEISFDLGINKLTVNSHTSSLLKKLGR